MTCGCACYDNFVVSAIVWRPGRAGDGPGWLYDEQRNVLAQGKVLRCGTFSGALLSAINTASKLMMVAFSTLETRRFWQPRLSRRLCAPLKGFCVQDRCTAVMANPPSFSRVTSARVSILSAFIQRRQFLERGAMEKTTGVGGTEQLFWSLLPG
jgi:hypothetical protein